MYSDECFIISIKLMAMAMLASKGFTRTKNATYGIFKLTFVYAPLHFCTWMDIELELESISKSQTNTVVDLHSKILDARPDPGSKFFQCHAVFG